MSPVSITYWGISGYAIFWFLLTLAVSLFLGRMYQLGRYIFLGRREGSFGQMARRVLTTAVVVLGQWCQFKNLSLKDRAGIGHVFMAWGFFIFVIFYLVFIIIGAGFGISGMLENTSFFFYYSWIMDIAAPFVIIAALWGIIRRYVVKPPRLEGEQTFEAMVILVTVLIHPMTHLFKEATSIALGHPPAGLGSVLPPVSSALSNLFNGSTMSSVQMVNIAFFWAHWSIVLFVLVFIAYSRYLHMVASIFNVFLQSPRPKGALRPIDLETAESLGASKITNFTWKQLLDCYSCVACGRCQDACPAYASGKPLNPKKVILNLKEHLLKVGPELLKGKTEASSASPNIALVDQVITEDEIQACTTCRACQEECPVYNEHIDKILDLRRNLVEEGRVSPSVAKALESMRLLGNPWEQPQSARLEWAEGRSVNLIQDRGEADILYWVGCAGAYDPRSRDISLDMLSLLEKAGVNYALLGTEERCCGDPARRMGEEGLFQMLARSNIEVLKKYGFKRILTHCPHCYNMFKNECPQLGTQFEVVHHSQFLIELIHSGRIKLEERPDLSLTFHDPCYLGRHNGIYEPARQVLQAIPKTTIIEMKLNRTKAMCCGAGGGQVWIQSEKGRRIEDMRFEQVQEVNVQIAATACPYCTIMLDAVANIKEPTGAIKVMDIAELVAKVLDQRV